MQTAKDLQTVKECKHLSGYELTYSTIHNLKNYNLTATAKLVLIMLTTHYNEQKNGAVVFPSIPYISDTLGIGQTATKKAIKDLITEGLIIKSKRGKIKGNYNKYILTLKVQNTACKRSENELFKQSENDLFHEHEPVNMNLNKEQQPVKEKSENNKPKNVVAFSSFSSFKKCKSVKLADVPNIIKENKNIKNPCGYWASLDENAKNEYIEKEKQKEQIRLKKIEFEKQEELRKIQEQKELEEIRKQPPFWETCNRQEAVKHLQNFKNMRQLLHTGYRQMLIDKYNIDAKTELLQ